MPLLLALAAVPLGADHAAARPRLGDGARLRDFGVLLVAGVSLALDVGLIVLGVLVAFVAVALPTC